MSRDANYDDVRQVETTKAAYERGYRDAIEAAAKEAQDSDDLHGTRVADRIRALTPAATTGERPPAEPPCGGSRCHLADDGTWIHSSKSYGTCSVRNAPAEPSGATCKTCGDTKVVRYCVCGCGLTEDAAVREAMRGPAALNRDQAEANIRTGSRPCPDCATPSPARPSEAKRLGVGTCRACGQQRPLEDHDGRLGYGSCPCIGRTGAR